MSFRLLAASVIVLVFLSLPASAEIVRWARSGDAATLDPHAAGDAMSLQLNRNIYEPLVERNADGTLSGRLAISWSIKPGEPSVWVFNLRPGVTFHDGAAFGADDVVFSFQRAGAPNSAVAAKLAGIANVRAVDDMAIEISLDHASPVFPAGLSDILIMDKGWAETHGVAAVKKPGVGDESFSTRNANGTGPYKLQSRDPDVRTALVVNDGYWSVSRPAATEIIYLPIINPAMQATALMRGEIDVLQDVAVADIKRIKEANGLKVETAAANDVLYLGYHFDATAAGGADASPLDNAKVREAIELAVDREKATEMADRGYDTATATLAPPFIHGRPGAAVGRGNVDRERAKTLLAEAGYPNGFAIKFDAPRGDAAVANRIASMLAGIGIWAEVTTLTGNAHNAYVASGKSEMYLSDFTAPGYDSSSIFKWLTGGEYGYRNAAIEARIDALDTIENQSERDGAVAALWEAVESQHIIMPIAQRVLAHAMRNTISVDVDPNGQTRFEAIRIGN